MTNHLYYGDNLQILREHIKDETVDLVYLDPPFNSQATYNVLFRATSGEQSKAQIEAFEDTWHWSPAIQGCQFTGAQVPTGLPMHLNVVRGRAAPWSKSFCMWSDCIMHSSTVAYVAGASP
jgi:hypothetical protein